MPSAQLDRIRADLERHKTIFDPDVVGDDVLDVAARVASERFNRQVDPDGNRWPDLDPDYERWKAKHAIGMQMGVLHGPMAGDPDEFWGMRSVTKAEAVSVYGTTPQARLEAEWFEEGDPSRNRPARPFTAMSLEAILAIDDMLDRHHEAAL